MLCARSVIYSSGQSCRYHPAPLLIPPRPTNPDTSPSFPLRLSVPPSLRLVRMDSRCDDGGAPVGERRGQVRVLGCRLFEALVRRRLRRLASETIGCILL